MANFKATFNANGTVLIGQLGGAGADPRTRAVIQQGGCSNRGHGDDDDRRKRKS